METDSFHFIAVVDDQDLEDWFDIDTMVQSPTRAESDISSKLQVEINSKSGDISSKLQVEINSKGDDISSKLQVEINESVYDEIIETLPFELITDWG
jgi:hypothetical protein